MVYIPPISKWRIRSKTHAYGFPGSKIGIAGERSFTIPKFVTFILHENDSVSKKGYLSIHTGEGQFEGPYIKWSDAPKVAMEYYRSKVEKQNPRRSRRNYWPRAPIRHKRAARKGRYARAARKGWIRRRRR